MELTQLSVDLRAIMSRQVEHLAMLREYLLGAQLIQASIFELPAPDAGAETRQETFIPTLHVTGQSALLTAIDAWGHISARTDESTRLVYRLPGALQLNSDDNDVIAGIVHHINQGRLTFKELVTSSPFLARPEDRHEFLHGHSMFPGLITLQMYRQIPMAPPGLRTVTFAWAHKHSQKNVTRDQILKAVNTAQETPPAHLIDPAIWISQLEAEKVLLASLPADTPLQIRRPLPVQPQIWLRSVGQPRMVVASTPLLILSPDKVKIGVLKDYNANQRRAPRQPKLTADEPLISRLWLYQKESRYDQHD
jgi:DNA replication terminus site-binding protein